MRVIKRDFALMEGLSAHCETDRIDGRDYDTKITFHGEITVGGPRVEEFINELRILVEDHYI